MPPKGPNYQRPEPLPVHQTVPEKFREDFAYMQTAQPADLIPRGAWWTIFKDPMIDGLMTQLKNQNPSIELAAAKYRQANAAFSQARAARLPILTGNVGATRGNSSVISNPVSNFSVGTAASWEIDLWGKISRTLEGSAATVQATAADLAATELSLQAQLVSNYVSLRFTDGQAALLSETVAAYERSLKLTQNRYLGGVVSKIDVVQAETQWRSTRAQLIDLGIQRATLEHSIAILLGQAPATYSLAKSQASLPEIYLPALSAGLPSQ